MWITRVVIVFEEPFKMYVTLWQTPYPLPRHGRPQTFFQWRAKIFQRGQEPTFCLKKQQKRYYFSLKSLKTYYFCPALAGQGVGARAPLALPCGPPSFTVLFDWHLTIRTWFSLHPIKYYILFVNICQLFDCCESSRPVFLNLLGSKSRTMTNF